MGKASAFFGKLQDRLWKNNHVSLRAKGNVYKAVVLSSILYGAETWTLYRSQVKKLHSLMMRLLRDVMNISWKDKIQNNEILRRVNLPKMEDILVDRNFRWLDHVHRMSPDRHPHQLLFLSTYTWNTCQRKAQTSLQRCCKKKYEAKENQPKFLEAVRM